MTSETIAAIVNGSSSNGASNGITNGTTNGTSNDACKKSALVTGADGQDGSYLCELLLGQGYTVHGLVRHHSEVTSEKPSRRSLGTAAVQYHYGDVLDPFSLIKILRASKPDEVYHLAAQSHVGLSFSTSSYTSDVDALGTLRVLEAIVALGMEKTVRFYNACSSEVFGDVRDPVQNEQTRFNPRSPYAVAKLYSYYTTVNFRDQGVFAVNGILFNHESPRRGMDFVTRKISRAVALIHHGDAMELTLGNLDSFRDWGHARDYVRGMWLMMQQDEPSDYVLATGETHSVRIFCEEAFRIIGVCLEWDGEGVDEVGVNVKTGKVLVRIDPKLARPLEVGYLLGSAQKAADRLKWKPEITFQQLVREMVMADIKALEAGSNLLAIEGPSL
ncbi:GDP-mannose 4, 6-dehydratase-like protein [Apodospora peruviana]|uniref:GDP-mannose 4,6-dehydratase n=1 Tax=Apodospora peruviana TaxID=516989 RepID=A0AAE0IKJ6_9PEZI|nr:GDP-mannose 4, 6-dehydratase-like protein [Apodospora peruviana]